MKSLKILGLTALSALAAMAFVGASSAMAEGNTALCGADQATCSSPITHVHETSVTKMKLLTSLVTVSCDVLFLGDALNSGLSNPLVIHGSLSYTSCSACTVTEENGPAEFKALKEGHETAKVTVEFLIHVVCGTSLDCSYIGIGLVGTMRGPLLSTQANGELLFTKAALTKEPGGFLCAPTANLDLNTTPLSATYIST